ncbi:MAG: HlyD family type I secretion periplasmic adaptor subunit [Alphaproteobacteria bacterium]|jgi:HlyD family secretion protein|uniref:HlyD family type I secretion periplasmic adaptor subunit n=1 Tax=Rhizobium sp. 'Codium 1' TaxID=2940484 RepID=UPI001E5C61E7|nr:HlyD family type I secretion periplasmic adaptor subunit [Rhizobium sp. 'Codium 1']MBU2327811.1 HlyD family type I secretion periplasmic adaptor subunit [Alphaproteobacteria bacterium]MCC8934071.1 HlyD family type I secretion periplasmic adaptor subunit [Rhizobium sp. 'Codium 1']
MADIAKVHDIEWYSEVPRSIRKQTIVGLVLVAVAFGGFGTWASTAPLAAAVLAQGSFVATGQNKILQHLEGGIIEQILVSEGDEVVEGQALVQLDETAALAKKRELFLRHMRLDVTAARLTAQFETMEKLDLSSLVKEYRGDTDVWAILVSQQLSFRSQQQKLSSEIALLQQNIRALEFREIGYTRQRDASIRQLDLLKDEYAAKEILLKKGVARANEVKAILRAIAEAEGQIGRLEAEIAETQTQRTKGEQEVLRATSAYREDALERLQAIQGERDMVRQQLREASNILERATINAPVSGTVVRIHYHTNGGVIESGKAILEILPADVPLIIEAQISRNDIDSVKLGQEATVRLVALNQRTTPVIQGEVFYLSADALQQSGNGSASSNDVYLARINIAPTELARVHGFTPTPGMPAEVMIQTNERTFFNYIAKPITDSMSRAFSEQ